MNQSIQPDRRIDDPQSGQRPKDKDNSNHREKCLPTSQKVASSSSDAVNLSRIVFYDIRGHSSVDVPEESKPFLSAILTAELLLDNFTFDQANQYLSLVKNDKSPDPYWLKAIRIADKPMMLLLQKFNVIKTHYDSVAPPPPDPEQSSPGVHYGHKPENIWKASDYNKKTN